MITNTVNRPDDIFSLFMYKLRKELKTRVDASVYVANDNDNLVIRINKGPFSFQHIIPQFGPKLLEGLTIDSVVQEVLKIYEKHILGLFFYKYR